MTDVIVTPEAVTTAGLVSYWRLSGNTNLVDLTYAWNNARLDPALLPKAPSAEVAFGRAMRDQGAKRRLVRPLARRNAWAIVEEKIVNEQPVYTTLMRAFFDKADKDGNGGGPRFDRGDGDGARFYRMQDEIMDAYHENAKVLDSTDVSSWLVDLAYKQSSVSLRETGGIYFVPRSSVDFWRRAADSIESVSAHRIFRIPAMKNAEAIDAITEAMTAEAEETAKKFEEELLKTGDEALGKRARASRKDACAALLKKIESYEQFLGVQMERVKDRVSALSASLVTAALVVPSEEERATV